MVILLLKKMFVSFHASMAGEKLLGPHFVPRLLTGGLLPLLATNSFPQQLQNVDLQTAFRMRSTNNGALARFYFCSLGILLQHTSETMDGMKWTNSRPVIHPDFILLYFYI